jgi:membrane protease YdiL (CAAX protease family)
MMLPPAVRLFTAVLVRPPRNTYTARLTASLAMISLLLPIPVQLVFDEFLPLFSAADRVLVDVPGLVGQLAGELLFAFAAVGLWLSRGSRDVWARLGLGPMGPREWMVAVVGLVTLSGLNSSLEWVERAWLPGLWQQDQSMGELITRDMGVGTALLLGVSAGVGEEVLVRGALQPRTGLFWASLLFAAAHVQNTTTAIVVHGVYDVIAAFGLTR